MVREIMLYTSNDLRDFMHLACASPLDIVCTPISRGDAHARCISSRYWSTYNG